MRILGIESSCDETAAAVVEDGRRVLSSVVASQMDTHGKYGGVVPELASREHLRAIVPVVTTALERAGCGYGGLAAVAVTSGPGLVGSLLVGMTYAKALCFAHKLPLIAVNHVEGHIHAVVMESGERDKAVEYPALALVVSGGHTHLFEVREGFHYRLARARRATTPRAKPSTRWPSCWGSATPAGRSSMAWRRTAIPRPSGSPWRA